MRYTIGSCFLFLWMMTGKAYAQETDNSEATTQKVTLSGIVANRANNETLIGATVVITEANTSVMTNAYGFYSITLPKGDYIIAISYMGFDNMEEKVSLMQSTKKDFVMTENSKALEEVVVRSGNQEWQA